MKQLLLFSVLLLTVNCQEMYEPTLIIGHRGAMGHETENTLASVQKALDLGVDLIEIDVFKIKSGEIVVFHDDKVDRLTNGTGSVEDYYYHDLRQLKLEGGHQIPMLQHVLKLINNKVSLNIELKGANTADSVNKIMELYVKEEGWSLDNCLISSCRWDELKEMRRVNKKVAIAILTEGNPEEAIPIAKELDAVAINPNYQKLTRENVAKIKEAGLKIYPWTVNEANDITIMKRMGVDGIITNYPERLH